MLTINNTNVTEIVCLY